MTTRTTRTNVSFREPFTFDNVHGVHPPGTYDVDTDEEMIEGLSFVAWRRIATFIHLPADDSMQMHRINPVELDANLMDDAGLTVHSSET